VRKRRRPRSITPRLTPSSIKHRLTLNIKDVPRKTLTHGRPKTSSAAHTLENTQALVKPPKLRQAQRLDALSILKLLQKVALAHTLHHHTPAPATGPTSANGSFF
jgi:hypothetical protein